MERSRLEALKQVGQMAWKGLVSAVKGVDVIIDPNEPDQPESVESSDTSQPSETSETVAPVEAKAIGSQIGRHAMRHNEHRMSSAVLTSQGTAIAGGELLQRVPVTLALYPGAAASLAEALLGTTGELLPPHGDLEQEATMRDMAWLPLEMGLRYFGRLADGHLSAAGGYRRAALVRFGDYSDSADVWCTMGEELFYRLLLDAPSGQLMLEESSKLWSAIASGRVKLALMGGDSLDRALAAGGTVQAELQPPEGLPWIPVWGLFAQRRQVSLKATDRGDLVLAPIQDLPGLLDWTGAVTSQW